MVITFLAGALTGLLAGKFLDGKSFGPIGDIALGFLGGFMAWLVADLLSIDHNTVFSATVTGFAGGILFRFGPTPTHQGEQPS